ncbi:MAG: hypothetical protein AAGJ46_17735 [Planctomycetota bacterium]
MPLDILGLNSGEGNNEARRSKKRPRSKDKRSGTSSEPESYPYTDEVAVALDGESKSHAASKRTAKPLLDRTNSDPPGFWASIDSPQPFGSRQPKAYFFRFQEEFEVSDRIVIAPLPGYQLDGLDPLDFSLAQNPVVVRQLVEPSGLRRPLTGWVEPITGAPHPHPEIPLDWSFAFYPDGEFLRQDIFPEAMLITAAIEAAVYVRLTSGDPVQFRANCFSSFIDPPPPRYRYGR